MPLYCSCNFVHKTRKLKQRKQALNLTIIFFSNIAHRIENSPPTKVDSCFRRSKINTADSPQNQTGMIFHKIPVAQSKHSRFTWSFTGLVVLLLNPVSKSRLFLEVSIFSRGDFNMGRVEVATRLQQGVGRSRKFYTLKNSSLREQNVLSGGYLKYVNLLKQYEWLFITLRMIRFLVPKRSSLTQFFLLQPPTVFTSRVRHHGTSSLCAISLYSFAYIRGFPRIIVAVMAEIWRIIARE